jgi:hypothetical protein
MGPERAWEVVQKDVPDLRSALESEFRQLLGVTSTTPDRS